MVRTESDGAPQPPSKGERPGHRLPGISWEEHLKLGRELYEMNERLTRLHVEVGNAYGVSSRVSKCLARAAESLSKLRSELDNRVCSEYPNRSDHEVTHVYYPGSRKES